MLRQIRYFQAVVRLNSFTEAAEECYISQSAISQQIQALENELGVKLLNREKRKFTLTPAGEHFYKKSLIITADLENLCRETTRIAMGDEARLRVGYLNCCGGLEFPHAIAEFSAKYPDVSVDIVNGSHEELYELLRTGGVDMALSDQRRAFSDEYVNFHLAARNCTIEISDRNPISQLERVNISELKNTSCILIASPEQRENEMTYYRDVVGFTGEFLFAGSIEEARLMVIGGRGFAIIDGGEEPALLDNAIRRVLLCRGDRPIMRSYCAFWKADESGYYVEEFADILRAQFAKQD